MEQENPGVSCTAKNGEKLVFAGNYTPLGAGAMISTG